MTVKMPTPNPLAFSDCESTGLDDRIHQAYEVCVWREDRAEPVTFNLPHSLAYADPQALNIGGYHDRGFTPHDYPESANSIRFQLLNELRGVTLVGANPAFDAGMLRAFLGTAVWHYRPSCVSDRAAAIFGWERPKSLLDTAQGVRDAGYDIPAPDHTAEGDVRTARAVYYALVEIAAHLRGEDRSA